MIVLENITKEFDQQKVLNNINLTIQEGSCIALDGVSGSGKSTLLLIIAALMKPTSGRVLFNGENVVAYSDLYLSKYRTKTILIPQHFFFFEHLSLEENLYIPLYNTQLSHYEIKERVEKMLDRFGLYRYKTKRVDQLSGGQRQRGVIARALLQEGECYLFDEPTAHLDKTNRDLILEVFEMLHVKQKTVVVASHDPYLLEANCIEKRYKLQEGVL